MVLRYPFGALEFESFDQSVYRSNASLTLSDEVDYTATWDITPDVDVDEGLGKVVVIPKVTAKIFGKKITIIPEVSFDFDTEFTFDFDSSGELGIAFGYRLDTGSIDTELVYDPVATFSDSLRYELGQSGALVDAEEGDASAGRFQVNPFGLTAYTDLVYDGSLLLDASLRLFGANILPSSLPPIDFSLPSDLPELRTDFDDRGRAALLKATTNTFEFVEFIFAPVIEAEIGNETLSDLLLQQFAAQGTDDAWYLGAIDFLDRFELGIDIDPYRNQIEVKFGSTSPGSSFNFPALPEGQQRILTYDLFDFRFNIPRTSPEDRTLQDGQLSGSDTDDFLSPRYDVDGTLGWAIVQATGLPIATDYNINVQDVLNIDLTILDVETGPDLRLRQDITVTPDDLRVTLNFTNLDGDPVTIDIVEGGVTQQVTSWTGNWNDIPEFDIDEATIVTPVFETAASLLQETGPQLGAGIELDIGALGFGFKLPKNAPFLGGKTIFKKTFGPLLELDFTEEDLFGSAVTDALFFPIAPTDPNSPIRVGDFGTIAGTPFVLDVEGTDDPGRSGFDLDGNFFDPVAVADGAEQGLTVGEKGRLVFLLDDLLNNDFDNDAFDTLSVIGFSQPTLGGQPAGSLTLREDGYVVYDPEGLVDVPLVFDGTTETLTPEPQSVEFTYTIRDAAGRTGTGTSSILVTFENEAPTAVADFYQALVGTDGSTNLVTAAGLIVDFDGSPTGLTANSIDFARTRDNDTDPNPGDRLIVENLVTPTSLGGSVELNGDGSFAYLTPPSLPNTDPGSVFFDTFEYIIRDETTPDTDPGVTGEVIVAFVVDAVDPALAPKDVAISTAALDLTEDGPAGRIGVVLTSQPDGTVVVDISGLDTSEAELSATQLTFDASNWNRVQVVDVTPLNDDASFTLDGPQNFDLTVSTSNGTATDYGAVPDQTVSITVGDPERIITEETDLTIAEDGGSQDFVFRLGTSPAPGTQVVVNVTAEDLGISDATVAPAVLTFDDSNWETGLAVTVTPVDDAEIDGNGTVDIRLSIDTVTTTDPAYLGVADLLVGILVDDDENAAPVVTFAEAATGEGAPVVIDALAGQVDPEGGTLTVTAASAPNGTAEISADGTQITYTPNEDFFTKTEGPRQVLINIPEGSTITAASAPNGTVDISKNILIYTPNSGFEGEDTISYTLTDDTGTTTDETVDVLIADTPEIITYTIADSEGATTENMVEVSILNVNDAPDLVPLPIEFTTEDTEIVIDLSNYVFDADGDALIYNLIGSQSGTFTEISNGVFSYLPDPDYFNSIPVTDSNGATVRDENGEILYQFDPNIPTAFLEFSVFDGSETETGEVFVSVVEQNDAPNAPDINAGTVSEDDTLTIDLNTLVLPFVTDVEGDAVTITDVDFYVDQVDPGGATVTRTSDEDTGVSFFYDPDTQTVEIEPGEDFQFLGVTQQTVAGFTYRVEDEFGGRDAGEVSFIIDGENDPVEAVDDTVVVQFDFQRSVIGDIPIPGTLSFELNGNTNLLANDIDPDIDDILTAALGPDSGANPIQGVTAQGRPVNVNSDGTYDFESVFGIFGEVFYLNRLDEVFLDNFDYTVTESGAGLTSIGGVQILFVGADAEPGFVLSEIDLLPSEIAEFGDIGPLIQERTISKPFTVSLSTPPSDTVVFTISSSNENEAVTDLQTLTFTPENWFVGQDVQIDAVQDGRGEGDGDVTITVEVTESNDANYAGLPAQTIDLTVLDQPEINEIRTTKDFIILDENGFDATFGVTLGAAPTSDVVVDVFSGDPNGAVAGPDTLTFTPDNWDIAQFVTVVGVDDNEIDGPSLQYILLEVNDALSDDAYDDVDTAGVFSVVFDDERLPPVNSPVVAPLVQARLQEIAQTEGESGTTVFTYVLTRSGDPVRMGQSSEISYQIADNSDLVDDDYAATADDFVGGVLPGGTVTFAAGQTEAVIAIEVAGDTLEEENEYFSLDLTAIENATIDPSLNEGTIINDDGASGLTPDEKLTLVVDASELAESGTASGTVTRSGDLSQALVVTLASSDTSAATVPASVTIAAGAATSDAFTIEGVDDGIEDGDQLTVILATAAGFTGDGQTLTVLDDQANQAPIANDDVFAADDTTATEESEFVVLDLLSNDSDPDSDPFELFRFDTSDLRGRLVTLTDGSLAYDANGGFDGLGLGETATDTFSYTITDGEQESEAASVTINITGTGTTTANSAPIALDDQGFETDALTEFTITNVLFNDIDPDGDRLVVLDVDTSGLLGTINNLTDGEFDYNPNGAFDDLAPGETAIEQFSYTVSDGRGGFDNATVSITVFGVNGAGNTAPVAGDDQALTDPDTAIEINAGFSDFDVDGDALTFENLDTTGTLGSVVNNGDGTFTYDPNGQFDALGDDETAIDRFTYEVSDGNGGSNGATVTVYINGIPTDGVIAVDDSASLLEDGSVNIDVLANDSGDGISVTSVSDPGAGTAAIESNGTLTYIPGEDFFGTDSFTYQITDATGATSTATVTVEVTPVNDAPGVTGSDGAQIVANDAGPQTVIGFVAGLAGPANEAGQALSYQVQTSDAGLFDALPEISSDGALSYTPKAGVSGTVEVLVTPVDNGGTENGGIDTGPTLVFEITITDGGTSNTPPSLNLPGQVSIPENQIEVFDIEATDDADSEGAGLAYAITGGDDAALFEIDATTGQLSFADAPDFETPLDADLSNDYDVELTVTDSETLSTSQTLRVVVEDVEPETSSDGDEILTAGEDDTVPLSGNIFDNFVDIDPSTEAAVVAIVATTASPGLTIDFDTGDYSFVAAGNYETLLEGQTVGWSIQYVIDDGDGTELTSVISAGVTGVNDAPVAVDDTVASPAGLGSVNIDVTTNDFDPDTGVDPTGTADLAADTISVTDILTPPSSGSAVIEADGTITYTDTSGNPSGDTFIYQITDSSGATASAMVVIGDGVPNLPPIANDDSAVTDEASAITIDVLDNDADPDGTLLTVTGFALDPGFEGSLTDLGGGLFEYDPAGAFDDLETGQSEDVSFTYTIEDIDGASASATAAITITGVSDGPQPILSVGLWDADSDTLLRTLSDGDTVLLSEIAGLDITISAEVPSNSSFFGQEESIQLDFNNGQITKNENFAPYALFGDNPAFNFSGQTDFIPLGANLISFDVFSANGGGGDLLGEVDISFTLVDDLSVTPPTALDDTLEVFESEAAGDIDLNVLDNDLSGTGDPLVVLSINGSDADVGQVLSAPGGGQIRIDADGTVDFDANGDFESLGVGASSPLVSLDLEIGYLDGSGRVGSTLDLQVLGENDAPVAVSDSFQSEGSSTVLDLTENDFDIDIGDSIEIDGFTQPVGGTLTQLDAGSLIFTPDGGTLTQDTSFTYEIVDPSGAGASATVTIIAEPPNEAPVAEDDFAVSQGSSTVIDVLENDSDPDGDAILIDSFTQPVGGTVSQIGDSLVFVPDGGLLEDDTSFTYTITDGDLTDTATVEIAAGLQPILSVGFYNSETDSFIRMLEDGDTVLASELGSSDLTIAAIVPDNSAFFGFEESIELDLNNGAFGRVENVTPYALFGDVNADFGGQTDFLIDGQNVIAFDVFSGNGASGDLLGEVDIAFTFVDDFILT